MNINNDLAENILLDWKKKNISPEDKSLFINELLKEKKISMRELARQLNIPHSTLQDWTSMRQQKKLENDKFHTSCIYTLADRLTYLLSKTNDFDDKTLRKLNVLRVELDKRLIK
jgi:transposase-like protein